MRSTLLCVAVLIAVTAVARADDRLAQDFARRHPDVKKFNPAEEALRQEVRARKITPAEAKRIRQAMNAGQAGGSMSDPVAAKRAYRMARAARRRAWVAASDAAGASFANAQITAYQNFVARNVAHY